MTNTLLLSAIFAAIMYAFSFFLFGIEGIVNLTISFSVVAFIALLAKAIVYLAPKALEEIEKSTRDE